MTTDEPRHQDESHRPISIGSYPQSSDDPSQSMMQTRMVMEDPDATDTIINTGRTAASLPIMSRPGYVNPLLGPDAPEYGLLRRIGLGGLGEVWESIHPRLSRSMAVKRIREDVVSAAVAGTSFDETDRSQRLHNAFFQEALITAALEHPNIVPVYDLGKDRLGGPTLCMKLIRGKTWTTLIDNTAALPMAEYLDMHLPILIDVAQAVAFAHSRGIVHRDLKPAQVMVGEFGEVLLADWGLGMVVDEVRFREHCPQLAQMDIVPTRETADNPAGTPSYMAPEQTEDYCLNIGFSTDIYLLGGILYFILSGRAPNEGKNSTECMAVAREQSMLPPSKRTSRQDIPPELEALCMRCLEKKPEERIESVTLFLSLLKDYMTGATRRQESREIAVQAQERLSGGPSTYAELSACETMLGRALRLWSENPLAKRLLQRTHAIFAQVAMDQGDLRLARLQAEHLTPSEDRDDLLHELNALEKLNDLDESQARDNELERRNAVERSTKAVQKLQTTRAVQEIYLEGLTALVDAIMASGGRGSTEASLAVRRTLTAISVGTLEQSGRCEKHFLVAARRYLEMNGRPSDLDQLDELEARFG